MTFSKIMKHCETNVFPQAYQLKKLQKKNYKKDATAYIHFWTKLTYELYGDKLIYFVIWETQSRVI